MRRTWWHRALSALLAVWFGVFVAEPAWLHACTVHAPGAAGGHAAAPAASHQAAGHHAAAGHDAPAAPDGAAPDGAMPDGAGHHCTCPGACCAVSSPALPAIAVQPVLDVPAVAADRGRPAHEYVAAWVDFVLPFATAPPSPAALV